MRRILIGTAATILAIASASSPAFAQYGGSPDDQVEVSTADKGDDEGVDDGAEIGAEAYSDGTDDQGLYAEEPEVVEDAGPPPEEGEVYQDDNGQSEDSGNYCRRSDGTTGLIVGGGAGALVGRGIDRRGERGTGTILGAIAGALIGTAIERSADEARCR